VQLKSFELSQRRCSGATHRRELSAASALCTRVVVASDPDVLLTHLAIEHARDYNLICRPVEHRTRLQAPRHGHVECVSRVLFYGSRPEPRTTGVTRVGLSGKVDRSRVNINTKRVGKSHHVDGGMFTTVAILNEKSFDP